MTLDASARHAVLDTIVAAFLEANPTKLPSTTTVLELIEWHHGQATQAPSIGGKCTRCGRYLSAVRLEMRLTLCSDCDRSHRRR